VADARGKRTAHFPAIWPDERVLLPMRTPLAWYNLMQNKLRTGIASSGVAFAIVLIFLQWGFLDTVSRTATLIFDHLDGDLIILSRQYQQFSQAGTFSQTRLQQARSVPGVASALPVLVGFELWRPAVAQTRAEPDGLALAHAAREILPRQILIMGCSPWEPLFLDLPELQQQMPELRRIGTILLDERSRPEFGPRMPGLNPEVAKQELELIGTFPLGTGFAADGQAVVSDETFFTLFPYWPKRQISLGIVRLEPALRAAGPAAWNEVREQLARKLPTDVRILTLDELRSEERRHWVDSTSVGQIFSSGMVLAFFVGLAVVYQVLSSDIGSRIREFATLKALGYSSGFLTGVVLEQSLVLAVLGFAPGLLVSALLYAYTQRVTQLPIELDLYKMGVVFVVAVLMCAISGALAVRKVLSADPADLF